MNMALGILFLWFVGMSVLAIVGTVLLFTIKKSNTVDVILVLMTAYSMLIAYMNATAQSVDLIGAQVFAWIVGLMAVVGTGIRFFTKKQLLISKLLIAGSVIAGIYFLYF